MRERWRRLIEVPVRFIEETVPTIFMLTMVIIVCYAVFSRYVLSRPIGIANEITVGLFIWTIFLGAAGAGRRHLHIGVEILANILPARWRAAHAIVVNLFVLILLLVTSHLAWSFALSATKRLQLTGIGYAWVYSAVPAGFLLLAAHQVPRLVRAVLGLWSGEYRTLSSIAAFAGLSDETTGRPDSSQPEVLDSSGAENNVPSSPLEGDG